MAVTAILKSRKLEIKGPIITVLCATALACDSEKGEKAQRDD